MVRAQSDQLASAADSLLKEGYWPALASRKLSEGRYSQVVELCNEHLTDTPNLVSGRLLYAVALHRAGQQESAAEQFYRILAVDPDNVVALKHLGDIACASGDDMTGMAYYHRVLEIDPHCRGLKSAVKSPVVESMHTVTLVRGQEAAPTSVSELRAVPFITETMGDLYLAQGHTRLAASVFKTLHERTHHPRLLEKLHLAEEKIKDREKRTNEHVTQTD